MLGRRAGILIVLLTLLAPACGNGALLAGRESADPKDRPSEGRRDDDRSAAGSSAKGDESKPKDGFGNPSQGGGGEPGSDGSGEQAGRMAVELEVAGCFEKGRAASATVRTEPASLLGMAVEYEGYKEHADYTVGATGADGSFKWVWTIPPRVPTGNAVIVALAQSADGERSGHARADFKVAPPGGCK